jgi:hypothetical protein
MNSNLGTGHRERKKNLRKQARENETERQEEANGSVFLSYRRHAVVVVSLDR